MAVRRLRIRRYYCLGLDGNLQLLSESLWGAFANTYGDRNGYSYRGAEAYADAKAASHTAASAVRFAF